MQHAAGDGMRVHMSSLITVTQVPAGPSKEHFQLTTMHDHDRPPPPCTGMSPESKG